MDMHDEQYLQVILFRHQKHLFDQLKLKSQIELRHDLYAYNNPSQNVQFHHLPFREIYVKHESFHILASYFFIILTPKQNEFDNSKIANSHRSLLL